MRPKLKVRDPFALFFAERYGVFPLIPRNLLAKASLVFKRLSQKEGTPDVGFLAHGGQLYLVTATEVRPLEPGEALNFHAAIIRAAHDGFVASSILLSFLPPPLNAVAQELVDVSVIAGLSPFGDRSAVRVNEPGTSVLKVVGHYRGKPFSTTVDIRDPSIAPLEPLLTKLLFVPLVYQVSLLPESQRLPHLLFTQGLQA